MQQPDGAPTATCACRQNRHLVTHLANRPANASFTPPQENALQSILFTCVYLATKVVDRMPHAEMLRHILTRLYNAHVSRQQTYEVRACVWERAESWSQLDGARQLCPYPARSASSLACCCCCGFYNARDARPS